MITECPRCGFIQPPDRFCANCGLDSQNYTPAKPATWKRFLAHPFFQLVVIIGLIGLMIFQLVDTKNRVTAVRQNATPTPAPSSPANEDLTVPEASPSQPSTTAVPEQSQALSAQKVAPSGSLQVEPKKPTTDRPQKMVIEFAEVPVGLIDQLSREGSPLGETATSQSIAYKLNKPIKEFSRQEPISFLPGSTELALTKDAKKSFQFTRLLQEDDDEMGLQLDVYIRSINEHSVALEMTGELNLRPEKKRMQYFAINGSYTLPFTHTLIVTGLVPRMNVSPEDLETLAGTPLMILDSADFMSETTQFVIFLQPR